MLQQEWGADDPLDSITPGTWTNWPGGCLPDGRRIRPGACWPAASSMAWPQRESGPGALLARSPRDVQEGSQSFSPRAPGSGYLRRSKLQQGTGNTPGRGSFRQRPGGGRTGAGKWVRDWVRSVHEPGGNPTEKPTWPLRRKSARFHGIRLVTLFISQ